MKDRHNNWMAKARARLWRVLLASRDSLTCEAVRRAVNILDLKSTSRALLISSSPLNSPLNFHLPNKTIRRPIKRRDGEARIFSYSHLTETRNLARHSRRETNLPVKSYLNELRCRQRSWYELQVVIKDLLSFHARLMLCGEIANGKKIKIEASRSRARLAIVVLLSLSVSLLKLQVLEF